MSKSNFKPIPEITEEVAQKVWSLIDKRGPDECWPWIGTGTCGEYGTIRIGASFKNRFLTTRVLWKITHNEDPGDLCVLHKCDLPKCCNPRHHFLGTRGDNNRDRHAKGRTVLWKKRAVGTRNARAKLNEEKVVEMRRMYRDEELSFKELGAKFGVSANTARCVVNGKWWTKTPLTHHGSVTNSHHPKRAPGQRVNRKIADK